MQQHILRNTEILTFQQQQPYEPASPSFVFSTNKETKETGVDQRAHRETKENGTVFYRSRLCILLVILF